MAAWGTRSSRQWAGAALAVWVALCAVLVAAPRARAEALPVNPPGSALLVRFRPPGAGGAALAASPTVSASVDRALAQAGVAAVARPLAAGSFEVTLAPGTDPQAAIAALLASGLVAYAEPDVPVSLPDSPAQPLGASGASAGPWGLDRVRASDAWRLSDGSGVAVAVLDTGVSASHPALAGRVLPGWDFVNDDPDASDDAGHGTFVASIVAGDRDSPAPGLAPRARILPVKVLDHNGAGSLGDLVAGIGFAVDRGARVINVSASGYTRSQALSDAIQYAEDHGAVVVASAGNHPDGQPTYPAAHPLALAVAATGQDDAVAAFSSYGPFVDLAAPGVDIAGAWWSPAAGNGYAVVSGTSAAAPFAAGAAALAIAARPDLSTAAVRQALTEAALDVDAPDLDARSGYGRLDAYLAVRLAAAPSSPAAASLGLDGPPGARRVHLSADGFRPGEPLSVWVAARDGTRRVIRGLAADGAGRLSLDLGLASDFPEGNLTAYAVGDRSGHAAQGDAQLTAAPLHPAFARIAPFPSSRDRVYFPETGHSLAYGFKAYWEAHGGLAVFGYPISEEFTENGHTVQYFERNRFEWHPEYRGTPYEVLLGRLGAQLAARPFPVAPPPPPGDPSARYFPETGHTLSGPFQAYWTARGRLPIFGYPISEPFEQGGRLVQYFERNRFELHPELPPEYQVLPTRLGVDLARRLGYLG